jgi:hypothetical protein
VTHVFDDVKLLDLRPCVSYVLLVVPFFATLA